LGKKEAEKGSAMTVWIYVDTSKQVGDRDHLKVFASEDAAEKCSRKTTPKAWRSNTRLRAYDVHASRRAASEFRTARVGPDHFLGPLGMAKSNVKTIRGENRRRDETVFRHW
jgi:hypothetical protein